jgi:hypothetical protein
MSHLVVIRATARTGRPNSSTCAHVQACGCGELIQANGARRQTARDLGSCGGSLQLLKLTIVHDLISTAGRGDRDLLRLLLLSLLSLLLLGGLLLTECVAGGWLGSGLRATGDHLLMLL